MRLFFGLEINPDTRRELAQAFSTLKIPNATLSLIRKDNIHLTMKFLGSIREERIPELAAAMQAAAKSSEAFSCFVKGTGCFPERGPIRIIWAGVDEGREQIRKLAAALEAECEKIGIPKEAKEFHPHVTLARVKLDRSRGRLRQAVAELAYEPQAQMIDNLALFESRPKADGVEYVVIEKVSLSSG